MYLPARDHYTTSACYAAVMTFVSRVHSVGSALTFAAVELSAVPAVAV